jgi:hypothetical protein
VDAVFDGYGGASQPGQTTPAAPPTTPHLGASVPTTPGGTGCRMETVKVRNRKVRINTVGEFCPWTATIVKERYMFECNLDTEHSILLVQPKSAIENDDFVNWRRRSTRTSRQPAAFLASSSKPGVPGMAESWGNGQPVLLRSRSSQAHKENRSRNGLPHGRCRRALNVTLCISGDQAFPRRADRGSTTRIMNAS